jgi:hypothetical protein
MFRTCFKDGRGVSVARDVHGAVHAGFVRDMLSCSSSYVSPFLFVLFNGPVAEWQYNPPSSSCRLQCTVADVLWFGAVSVHIWQTPVLLPQPIVWQFPQRDVGIAFTNVSLKNKQD